MSDQRVAETWNEIVRRAAREKDIELEAALLGIGMTIASAKIEDPEIREHLVRGVAIAWRHTDRFKAGETPLMT